MPCRGKTSFPFINNEPKDWLFRGNHPVVAAMSFQVYAMWVFRIEFPAVRANRKKRQDFVDIEFASEYALAVTHMQRIATELRVPLFEGFLMPASNVDSETAAMYKQILLRPTAVEPGEEPEDLRVVGAFRRFCALKPNQDRSGAGANAFTRNWLAFAEEQEEQALVARRRFLDRYEWPSLWETQEVCDELRMMWLQSSDDAEEREEEEEQQEEVPTFGAEPSYCFDREKPRATLQQYVALVGEEVAVNLEGIARARLEKRPRQYQSDASVHQTYMQATSGGAGDADGEEADIAEAGAPPKSVLVHFEPIPWNISSIEDMQRVLEFKLRTRLTPFAKALLELPCMQAPVLDMQHHQQGYAVEWKNHWFLAATPASSRARSAGVAGNKYWFLHSAPYPC